MLESDSFLNPASFELFTALVARFDSRSLTGDRVNSRMRTFVRDIKTTTILAFLSRAKHQPPPSEQGTTSNVLRTST